METQNKTLNELYNEYMKTINTIAESVIEEFSLESPDTYWETKEATDYVYQSVDGNPWVTTYHKQRLVYLLSDNEDALASDGGEEGMTGTDLDMARAFCAMLRDVNDAVTRKLEG